ncbi:phosphate ABC transporter permease PstA [Ornithinimicrobium sediminis]|uniref:phosphate ABC transporter permease PstA n=1 Tax=Ornithinimicrobium sediminis TaxID=2904603 RepID=UPI001E62197B|nr:phosphate ABC transporter permease PstA [Ornithinimicrobium sediminis]MCE0487338.1 phosphate ABC transporter permease PstA [Ornithinimicrobium sediminis]
MAIQTQHTGSDVTPPPRKRGPMEGIELSTVRPAGDRIGYAVLLGALALAATLWLAGGLNVVLAAVVGFLVYLAGVYTAYRVVGGRRVATDHVMRGLVYGAFILAVLPLVSLLWTVVGQGIPRAFHPDFLLQTMNGVTGVQDEATMQEGAPMVGGAYHAVVGTLVITGIATVLSVPIGLFTAIYLVEYSNKNALSHVIRFLVDVMTGIPSIVAGLFAFALWAMVFGIGTKDALAGAVALSVLMIPTVVRSSEEMLRIVPNDLREASLALGVPKWRTVAKVVLPTAASGLASGVTLAIARVIGETAPLLVAVGYARGLNLNPVEGPMNSLAVYAYYMFTRPLNPGFRDPSLERAWAAALLLVLLVVALNLTARLIAKLFAPKTGR